MKPAGKGCSRSFRVAAAGTLLVALALRPAIAAAAVKPLISSELVRNGGAEIGKSVSDSVSVAAATGWTTTGSFTAVKYGAPGGFPDAAASRAIAGGKQFFTGGPSAKVGTASQVVPVPAAFRKPGLKVTAKLSAALGGYSTQSDNASVTATFLSSAGSPLGTLKIGPVSRAQRGDATKLVSATRTAALPRGTTAVKIVITARPISGGYVDGYADNVSLHLVAGA